MIETLHDVVLLCVTKIEEAAARDNQAEVIRLCRLLAEVNGVSMKQLEPGLYDDEQGALHIDVGELLRAHGFADTAVNRAQVARVAREWITNRFGIDVVITTQPVEH